MATVKIGHIVQKVSDNTAATATVTVRLRGTLTNAQLYNASGGTIGNPVTTTSGRIEAWVDEGRYDLVVSGAGFSTYTQEFEAVAPTLTGSITSNKLADGAVTNIKINDGAITGAKISDGTVPLNKLNQSVNSAVTMTGAFSARPAQPFAVGTYFLATDIGSLYLSDGTNWVEVAPGAGSAPIGTMFDYFGATDPADTRWVIADGRTLSTTTYATLFAIIGTNYNTMASQAAPGAGLFRIPKMAGRATIAAGTATGAVGATNHTLHQVGGEETHALSATEMPQHNHTFSGSGSFPYSPSTYGFSGAGDSGYAGASNAGGYMNGGLSIGGTIGYAGGSGAHQNMQPFVAVNKIIRIT